MTINSTPPAKVYYSDGKTPVILGDHVKVRIWLKRYIGRVVYIPGHSKMNDAMDYNGLCRVGIRTIGGLFIATNVQPGEDCLKKKIVFMRRDPADVAGLRQSDDPFAE